MKRIELNGSWRLKLAQGKHPIPAKVPGCVHLDLIAARKIADPFYRDNENYLSWISENDWTYFRDFTIQPEILTYDRVLLQCDGLDTLAEIKLNAKHVAETDNMFRKWEFNIKNILKKGTNTIEIRFNSTLPYIKKKQKENYLFVGESVLQIVGGISWVRKEPCNFGWDWGPKCITSGIWKDIRIIAFNEARLKNVQIFQDHTFKNKVGLDIPVSVEKIKNSKHHVVFSISYNNKTIVRNKVLVKNNKAWTHIPIKQPELWWPNHMGGQPMYNIKFELLNKNNDVLDTVNKRIGLRTLRLERKKDKYGESFQFKANGIPFFAKGANWIPADVFLPRMNQADYDRLLKSAAEANMNMLRVWGGGIYENDIFYDICDELGICIWQDFIFANAVYPTFDPDFMRNIKIEAQENIQRLRHHPCLALWCGNNEIEQFIITKGQWNWKEYSKIFDKLLFQAVRKFDPDRDYWPSSGHTPGKNRSYPNDPTSGDAHLWNVYHHGEPIEWYRTSSRPGSAVNSDSRRSLNQKLFTVLPYLKTEI